ncbi:MAG: hypothetical protein LBT98_01290 [Puniceicoccales bacterium]|nr:hypothetical protein [Puniceicoccales bacterium]
MEIDAPGRLQKFLARNCACSRRKAEEAIARGEVAVDGVRARTGDRLDSDRCTVTWNGALVEPRPRARTIAIALNKPRGYLCTHGDPHLGAGQTIYSLLPLHGQHRLFCCGRLDRDSEGLLILTNDGQLANRLSHPSNGVAKFYRVAIDLPLGRAQQRACLRGVRDGEDWLRMDGVEALTGDRRILDVRLGGGKKRHIRRLLGALGYRVLALQRYRVGNFFLNLRPGRHRKLGEREIRLLCADLPIAQNSAAGRRRPARDRSAEEGIPPGETALAEDWHSPGGVAAGADEEESDGDGEQDHVEEHQVHLGRVGDDGLVDEDGLRQCNGGAGWPEEAARHE